MCWWCCDLSHSALVSAERCNAIKTIARWGSWLSDFSARGIITSTLEISTNFQLCNFSCPMLFFLCTCKTIFLFLSRICSRKSAICEKLCRKHFLKLKSHGKRKIAPRFAKSEKKLENFQPFKKYDFCIFMSAANTPNREKLMWRKKIFSFFFRSESANFQ